MTQVDQELFDERIQHRGRLGWAEGILQREAG